MHTIKDVTEDVFKLVTGRDDSQKVHSAELALGRWFTSQMEPTPPSSTVKMRGKRSSRAALPSSTFSLTKSQCKLADTRLLSTVLPTHIDHTPKKNVLHHIFCPYEITWLAHFPGNMLKRLTRKCSTRIFVLLYWCCKQTSCWATWPSYVRQVGRRHEFCSCGHGTGLSSNTLGIYLLDISACMHVLLDATFIGISEV